MLSPIHSTRKGCSSRSARREVTAHGGRRNVELFRDLGIARAFGVGAAKLGAAPCCVDVRCAIPATLSGVANGNALIVMMPSIVRRALLAVVFVAILVPAGIKTATARRGSQIANDLCSWLNAKTSEQPPLRVGPEAQAILDDQRETGAPVECTRGSSPFAESSTSRRPSCSARLEVLLSACVSPRSATRPSFSAIGPLS
jgi:hypothetical protein